MQNDAVMHRENITFNALKYLFYKPWRPNQILTSKVDPRQFIMAVDHRYSCEAGKASKDFRYDFKFKKPFVLLVYIKIAQRFKG